jgi:hypothetical protein
MSEHELKTWPGFFAGLTDGTKTAEVRRNDRSYQVGDVLVLREFNAETDEYTGRFEVRTVSRVDDLRLVTGVFGFVLLSFKEKPTHPSGSQP